MSKSAVSDFIKCYYGVVTTPRKWVEAELPVAFQMEEQIYFALHLYRLNIYNLNEEMTKPWEGNSPSLKGNVPLFLSTRADVVCTGSIKVYKADFVMSSEADKSLGFKSKYTLTFPVSGETTDSNVTDHLSGIIITVAESVTFLYKRGSCKVQKG